MPRRVESREKEVLEKFLETSTGDEDVAYNESILMEV